MELTNDTILRGYLSHIRSLAVQMAGLYFEYMNHPDADGPPPMSENAKEIQDTWSKLSDGLEKVIGVKLVPWNQLGKSSTLIARYDPPVGALNQGDPLRIRMSVLKRKADKARIKDPTITLMKSWSKPETEGGDADEV